MAGLLGDNFGYVDPGVGLAAGLLAGRGNLGANLAAGLLGGQQSAQANRQFTLVQQNAERANRANDLQQVGALYKMALQRDMLQAAQDEDAGKQHIPDPMLGVLQQKMSELAGLPPLSAGAQPVSAMPQGGAQAAPGAQATPSPFQYGSNPSLNQAPQSAPVGQNFKGANPNYQPLPLPTSQIGQSPTPIPNASSQPPQPSQFQPQGQGDIAAQLARYRRQGDAFAFAGLDPIAQSRYKLGMPTVSRGVSFNPSTGLPIAGFVDNVPVRFDAQGSPQVIQSGIPQAIADRAGAVAGAQAAATSPYKIEMTTDASGRQIPKFLPQLPGYPGAQQPSPQPTIPAAVQAAADRGQPFVATQAPGQPVQFQQPPPAKDVWDAVPTIPQESGLGQTTQSKEMTVQRATVAKELSQEMGAVATANAQRIATNTQALDLVDKADTGAFAAHIQEYRNLLGSLGVKSAADQAATDQALGKDLVNTALQKGKQLFGSRFTQSEVGIMLSRANPSPEMQKAAIKFLLETDNAMSQYGIQEALDFGKYLSKNGDPFLYKSWYATAMPMADVLKSVHLGKQVPANQGRPPLSSFGQ